jgi:hypothetical protein
MGCWGKLHLLCVSLLCLQHRSDCVKALSFVRGLPVPNRRIEALVRESQSSCDLRQLPSLLGHRNLASLRLMSDLMGGPVSVLLDPRPRDSSK